MYMTQVIGTQFLDLLSLDLQKKLAEKEAEIPDFYLYHPMDCHDHQGNFTIGVLRSAVTGRIYCAATKRDPYTDEDNFLTANRIVAKRAVKELLGENPGYGRNPVGPILTIKERARLEKQKAATKQMTKMTKAAMRRILPEVVSHIFIGGNRIASPIRYERRKPNAAPKA